jgi:hypothetical protein
MNYNLIKQNFTTGRIAEISWLKRLNKKYPSILDNNIKDKYSSMDAISNENGIIIEHEHKNRHTTNHYKYDGLMVNECKITKSIKQLKKGIRQIFYWTCKDGLYYWELTDIEKQKNEILYYRNGNIKTGEGKRDVVDIKTKYLRRYED